MTENPGEDVLFVGEDLALSESSGLNVNDQVVLYGPDIARGPSTPQVDDDALLIAEQQAQSGPGIIAHITIRDSQGESSGDVVVTSRNQTVEDYCDFGSTGNEAVSGPISDELLEVGATSFLLYENADTGEQSFGFFHDKYDEDANHGGDVHWDVTGLPDSTSIAVADDPNEPDQEDVYDINPPDGHFEHNWGSPNTDGVALGPFDPSDLAGVTVTFSVTQYDTVSGRDRPSTIQFVGDDGSTVERAYDGTNTVVEITF